MFCPYKKSYSILTTPQAIIGLNGEQIISYISTVAEIFDFCMQTNCMAWNKETDSCNRCNK